MDAQDTRTYTQAHAQTHSPVRVTPTRLKRQPARSSGIPSPSVHDVMLWSSEALDVHARGKLASNHSVPHTVTGSMPAHVQDGETALHLAAAEGSLERVRACIYAGADVNAADGVSVAHAHVRAETQEGVGTSPQLAVQFGWTPLHDAAAGNAVEVISALLAADARTDMVTANGRTPLLLAVEMRAAEAAGLLVRAGADLLHKDHTGFTAVYLAAGRNDVDTLTQMLEAAQHRAKAVEPSDHAAISAAFEVAVTGLDVTPSRETLGPAATNAVAPYNGTGDEITPPRADDIGYGSGGETRSRCTSPLHESDRCGGNDCGIGEDAQAPSDAAAHTVGQGRQGSTSGSWITRLTGFIRTVLFKGDSDAAEVRRADVIGSDARDAAASTSVHSDAASTTETTDDEDRVLSDEECYDVEASDAVAARLVTTGDDAGRNTNITADHGHCVQQTRERIAPRYDAGSHAIECKPGSKPAHSASTAGASVSERKPALCKELLAAFDEPHFDECWTCMHVAAMYGADACIDVLGKYGAPIEAQDAEGLTPLHIACEYCHLTTVRILISLSASAASMKTEDGRSVWHVLARYCQDQAAAKSIAETLRESAAAAVLADKDAVGNTAYDIALQAGNGAFLDAVPSN